MDEFYAELFGLFDEPANEDQRPRTPTIPEWAMRPSTAAATATSGTDRTAAGSDSTAATRATQATVRQAVRTRTAEKKTEGATRQPGGASTTAQEGTGTTARHVVRTRTAAERKIEVTARKATRPLPVATSRTPSTATKAAPASRVTEGTPQAAPPPATTTATRTKSATPRIREVTWLPAPVRVVTTRPGSQAQAVLASVMTIPPQSIDDHRVLARHSPSIQSHRVPSPEPAKWWPDEPFVPKAERRQRSSSRARRHTAITPRPHRARTPAGTTPKAATADQRKRDAAVQQKASEIPEPGGLRGAQTSTCQDSRRAHRHAADTAYATTGLLRPERAETGDTPTTSAGTA
ncbi:uncharacterized protein LOC143217513 [Lasioglossum baleicum]|uniref:uncharacterized protein LOC143217513 n=1 Tax=Lasioglossum baleicum TaxID=434251 RepID=UPI003FCED9B7